MNFVHHHREWLIDPFRHHWKSPKREGTRWQRGKWRETDGRESSPPPSPRRANFRACKLLPRSESRSGGVVRKACNKSGRRLRSLTSRAGLLTHRLTHFGAWAATALGQPHSATAALISCYSYQGNTADMVYQWEQRRSRHGFQFTSSSTADRLMVI